MLTVSTADALVALLQADPNRRLVEVLTLDDEDAARAYVLTVDDAGEASPFACIAAGSTAQALLDEAYEADLPGAEAPAHWASLPLRYGPFCSTWVLATHPLAPRAPAEDGARGQLYTHRINAPRAPTTAGTVGAC